MPPDGPPTGLQLALTAKAVSRAFNEVLQSAGGTLPVWLVLNALRAQERRTQLELARAIGIEGPTLTRHLDGMERAGLVERRRGSADRRAVQVELTPAGRELHRRLRQAVIGFNRRLHDGITADDVEALRRTLARLEANVREEPRAGAGHGSTGRAAAAPE
jgi:MarR family transcriptional regulator, transcriptional regulator for hemolysin